MAATLGESPLAYGPYYFLGFLSPAILFGMGLTGRGISYVDDGEEPGDGIGAKPTGGDD